MINVKYGFISSAISRNRLGDISSTAISTVTLDAVTVDILDALKRWHHALHQTAYILRHFVILIIARIRFSSLHYLVTLFILCCDQLLNHTIRRCFRIGDKK